MDLCDLPDDVLLLVVRRACDYPGYAAALALKSKLALLAVCHRLRALALPVVYDRVYAVVYVTDHDRYHERWEIRTNLDLVSSLGCLHLVRRADIRLASYSKNPILELCRATRRIRDVREQWDAVHTLYFMVDGRVGALMERFDSTCTAQGTAATLTAMFPSVQQLYFGIRVRNPAIESDHSWAAFSADRDESRDIWFPTLQVLERGVFPERMDMVTVEATVPGLLKISSVALPSARCLQLFPRGYVDGNPAAVAAVQRMLDSVREQPETLASTSLTGLEASVIDADAMPGADRLVEPINSTLKSVRISFYHDDQDPEPAVLTLKYLLLAVPSLSVVSVYGISDSTMEGIVDAYANQYPHLARLKVNIHAHQE
ncbi:hypothetical protein H4R18_000551 [Coemansia javaensis]|uniref:F-box domain-containing protein n=1 Tax=Coemansia javaensis TaxID=2761396 RepID=A0A9W8HHV1_9FUNG|nr:hypothetical protein H4R18_000551 [Coemansia javaensis]